MRIALIDKAPSRNKYSEYLTFKFEEFHMSSQPVQKLYKKDVDLDIDVTLYDLVILVGSEAAKEYAKVGSVTTFAGNLIHDRFFIIPNPAALHFKPEGKPLFDKCVDRLHKYVSREITLKAFEGDFKGIDNEKEALAYLQEVLLSNTSVISLDTEGTALYPRDGYVLGISISYKPDSGRYILTDILTDELIELLQLIIDTKRVVFHNMKYDIKMLEYHLKLKFNEDRVDDTILMHYILDENGEHGLKALALKYTEFGDYDAELDAFKKSYCKQYGLLEEEFTYDLIPFNIISVYASKDTAVCLTLYLKFIKLIEANPKLLSVYKNLLVPGTMFFHYMEENGIPINVERIEAADVYLDEEINKLSTEIYTFEAVAQYEKDTSSIFNPNSVQQLRVILFDYLGLQPTGKLTGTGAISTDAEVLEDLGSQHPLPAVLLKKRQLTKLKNTYVSKIRRELDKDGRIRTSFNLIFTTSGRASSSGKFNAQQIPRDDPIIKGLIQAPPGYKVISQDLQTGEMYYAAVLSGDKNLQLVFSTGGDFHSTIAKMVFNLPCAVEDVKKLYPAMRQSAKAISFGINL